MKTYHIAVSIVGLSLLACGGDGDSGTGPEPLPKGPRLTIVSGDRQVDTVGQALALPLAIVLKDTLGQPISGATVDWSVVTGGGIVTPSSVTGSDGQATATYTLGTVVTVNSVRAFSSVAVAPVFFTQNTVHDVPAQLIRNVGDSQYSEIGVATATQYGVKVADQYGNGIAQMDVQWAVPAGNGSVSAPTSVSDAAGIARTRHTPALVGPNMATASPVAFIAPSVNFTTFGVLPATLVAEVPVPPNYGAHDTFVRDGIAFHCAWNTGVLILDVGNGMAGGTPSHPIEISRLITSDNGVPGGPAVHNAWWFHNPVTNEKRYLFIGQEGIGVSGSNSSGDIHIVDVSDLSNPVEVGFYTMPGAGTHNFWMDEANQVLYAAYYNGGVVAIDVSGTLSGNISSREIARIQPGGPSNTATWGVMLYNGSLYASDIVSGFYQLKHVGLTLSVVAGGNNLGSDPGIGTDLWVANGYAYTGFSGGAKSKVMIWQLSPTGAPVLVGSVPAPTGTFNLSDVEVSPSGKLLMFSTEGNANEGYYFYNLSDPVNPKFVSRYLVPTGLHTATFGTINGRLYAFGAKDPPGPSMMILDVTSLDF
jgi:hypothetical protein